MLNVTHFHCPVREEAIPGDEKTHHLILVAGVMTCLFCKRTERELRAELTAAEELKGLSVVNGKIDRMQALLDTPPIPEGLCGAYSADSDGGCVFTYKHEGKHSWQ